MSKQGVGKKGFTLAQLLMILAIAAIVVSISIPIFMRELERSLESTDFSTVRTVYAEFMADILGGDEDAVINKIPIKQADDTYRVAIYPLSQRMDGWTLRIDNKQIGGVPSSEWIGTPRKFGACIISYDPKTDKNTIHWGTAFPLMTLGQLHEISDKARVEEDQRLLRELGEKILRKYWTVEDLKKALELPEAEDAEDKEGASGDGEETAGASGGEEAAKESGGTEGASGDTKDTAKKSGDTTGTSGGAIRIADYYQLKKDPNNADGFKIVSTQNDTLEDLLRSAGYEPGTTWSSKKKGKKQKTTVYEYNLFFSDELAANHAAGYSNHPAKRSIFIDDIQTEKDLITGLTIYTKAMDDQAPMTEKQKAQFRITVK